MKRVLIIVLLLLVVGTVPAMAQQLDRDGDGIPNKSDQCPFRAGPASNNGCPADDLAPNPPQQPADSDGDGLPDSDDQCPNAGGPRDNRGCPVDSPPNNPPAGDPSTGNPPAENPPAGDQPAGENPSTDPGVIQTPEVATLVPPQFVPPVLPTDGCHVTPGTNTNVNVRKDASLDAEVIGYLLPGVVYAADGYVLVGTDMWFVLNNYENNDGEVGYVSRLAVLASLCSQIAAASESDFPWQVVVSRVQADGQPNTTVEYCVYQEVEEAGVFKQVCYEVEVPEGCVVVSSEAGVFTFDCGGGAVSVNPLFDDLPAEGLEIPNPNGEAGFVMGLILNPAADQGNSTAEYCVYQETVEAGVFQKVCIEIEVPEGCWLESVEAGVFTTECPPALGGEVSFKVLDTLPPVAERPHADWRTIFGDLVACETGQVWWLDYKEPVPGQGPVSCVDTFDQLPSDQRPAGMNRLVGVRVDDNDKHQITWEAWLDLLYQFCHPQGYWAMENPPGEFRGGCAQASIDGSVVPPIGLTIVNTNPDPMPVEAFWMPLDDGSTSAAEPNPLTPGHFCPDTYELFATWEEDADGNLIPGSVTTECLPPGFWD